MSLGALFETLDLSLLSRTIGIDPSLYEPARNPDEPSYLRELLGVLGGRITYETRFSEALEKHDYQVAYNCLRHLPAPLRTGAQRRLNELLQKECDQREAERAALLKTIARLDQREDLQDQDKELLNFARTELEALAVPIVDEPSLLEHLTTFRRQTYEWQVGIQDIEKATNARWIETRRLGFEVLREALPYIEQRVLSHPGEATPTSPLFGALPKLIISGQLELMGELLQWLRSDGTQEPQPLVERLRALKLEFGVPQRVQFKVEPASNIPTPRTAVPLSPIGNQLINRAPPLTQPPYSEPRTFRAELERLVQVCLEPEPIVDLYRSAAATLRSQGQNDLDLVARALSEEGGRVIQQGRYSLAMDLFGDAFKVWADFADSEWFDFAGMQRAGCGLIAASLLLRLGARLPAIPLEAWLESPRELFDAVAQTNQNESVLAQWHRLSTHASRVQLLEFIESNAPSTPWRELLLMYVLQPRRIMANLSQARERLDALFNYSTPLPALGNLLNDYLVALEGARRRDRFGRRELVNLKTTLEEFTQACPASASSLERILRDALVDNLHFLEQEPEFNRPQIPLTVTATPLTRVLYPGELEGEPCSIIFSVKVNKQSEPASSLVIELDLKDAEFSREWFEFVSNRIIEVGDLEPDESREVACTVRIDPRVLDQVSAITLQTSLREGVRPLDRGRTKHRIDLRPTRAQLTARSPFTTGKSLGIDDLFVGRDKEMRILQDHLLGDGTEKIPLVVGIRRIGKTTLLKRLSTDAEIRRRYEPCIYDLQDMAESRTTAEFLADLAEHIRVTALRGKLGDIPLKRADFQVDGLGAFERFIESTEALTGTKKVLVIFDEFEKLLHNLELWKARQMQAGLPLRPEVALIPETLAALRKAMLHAPRVSFLVCGIPKIWNMFQSYDARMFGLMNPMQLQALDDAAARKLVNAANLYRLADSAETLLLRMSGRQPYLLQVMSEDLFQHMLVSGRDVATATDVEQIIERSILPNEAYWTDYTKLLGEDRPLYRAVALAQRRLPSSRFYAPFELIYKMLAEQSITMSREAVRQRLVDECRHNERPLIQQNPSNNDHFGLTIGLLIPILTKEL